MTLFPLKLAENTCCDAIGKILILSIFEENFLKSSSISNSRWTVYVRVHMYTGPKISSTLLRFPTADGQFTCVSTCTQVLTDIMLLSGIKLGTYFVRNMPAMNVRGIMTPPPPHGPSPLPLHFDAFVAALLL